MEGSLISAADSRRELQKDQTISKKNKSIIYQDIDILSLHSTTSNAAHENYSTENILYQEWHTRSMNNLSLLSLPEQASLQIRNEAKQKKNVKKSQAADTPFKQTPYQGLNSQNFPSSNCVTLSLCENTQGIHMSVRHFWMYTSSFSFKVQVSIFYTVLDTTRHWNHIDIVFNVKINCFKNENYPNSYRLKDQLTNYNTGTHHISKISTNIGTDEIDSHAEISGPWALWYPKQPSHITPFLYSSSSIWKTRCLVSTAHACLKLSIFL